MSASHTFLPPLSLPAAAVGIASVPTSSSSLPSPSNSYFHGLGNLRVNLTEIFCESWRLEAEMGGERVLIKLFFILSVFDVTILVVACSIVVQDGENWVHRISALLFLQLHVNLQLFTIKSFRKV